MSDSTAILRNVMRRLRRTAGHPERFTERQREALVKLVVVAMGHDCPQMNIQGMLTLGRMLEAENKRMARDGKRRSTKHDT